MVLFRKAVVRIETDDVAKPLVLLIMLPFLLLTWMDVALANVLKFSTVDHDREVKIVSTASPGGLAVDKCGNIYYSIKPDETHFSGRIVMLWGYNYVPITLLDNLTYTPGDVELSSDGRALLVVDEDFSTVHVYYFGVTLQIRDDQGSLITDAIIYAQTDVGTTKGYTCNLSNQYYRIPNILVPEQHENTIRIIIERSNKRPLIAPVTLGTPGCAAAPQGETIVLITIVK